jgi:hypothetical protein
MHHESHYDATRNGEPMKHMLDAIPEDTRTPYQRFEDSARRVRRA